MIYACMSRRMLMGDDLAELEFDFYENINPNATWAHGYGEILHAKGLRGFLNASLVAVGIREGEVTEEEKKREFKELDIPKEYLIGYKPLSERLVRFLESTTSDLRSAVDQLFRVASMDELTQIYNRRALNHFMQQQIDAFGSEGEIMVLLVDIDHFKHVNDTYGHDVGDKVITKAAKIIQNSFRTQDYVCRIGGDEFAVIMIRSDSSMKDLITRKVNLINEKIGTAEEEEGIPSISCSVGVAFGRVGLSVSDLFKRADSALYNTKQSGRKGVSFYSKKNEA